MTKSLHIRVPEPLIKQIEKIESDEDKSKTNVVVDLLELGLLSKQKKNDLIQRKKLEKRRKKLLLLNKKHN